MRKRTIVWPALALAVVVPALGGAAPLKVQPPQLSVREHRLANEPGDNPARTPPLALQWKLPSGTRARAPF